MYRTNVTKIANNFLEHTLHDGIHITSSSKIDIKENTIKLPHQTSIAQYFCKNGLIERNNLEINPNLPDPIDDRPRAYNKWDNNYYSDTSPTCKDANNDNICDNPRIIAQEPSKAPPSAPNSVDYAPSKIII